MSWPLRAIFACCSITLFVAASAFAVPASQYERCNDLNTAAFGEDGKHGLALQYHILQQELSNLDGLIAHQRQRVDTEQNRDNQLQAGGKNVVDQDLVADKDLLSQYQSARAHVSDAVTKAKTNLVAQGNALSASNCPARTKTDPEPKAPYQTVETSYGEETVTQRLPGESDDAFRCRAFNVELYGTDGRHGMALERRLAENDVAAAMQVMRYIDLIRSIQFQAAADFVQKTGRESTELEAQLKNSDVYAQQTRAGLDKYNSTLRRIDAFADMTKTFRELAKCHGILLTLQTPEPTSDLSGDFAFTWEWSVTRVTYLGKVTQAGPTTWNYEGKLQGGGNAIWHPKLGDGSVKCTLTGAFGKPGHISCTAPFSTGTPWTVEGDGTIGGIGPKHQIYFRGRGKGTGGDGKPADADFLELQPANS